MSDGVKVMGMFVGIAALIAVFVIAAIREDSDWQKFKADHHCKVVGYTKGSADYGVTYEGKGAVVFESDKTSWLCDDGVTYTR